MVSALQVFATAFGGMQISWSHDAYRVDGTRMLGSLYQTARKQLEAHEGVQCLEWLPYAGLADLHVYTDGGTLMPIRQAVYGAPRAGRVVDVITWQLEQTGILWVKPQKPRWRGNSQACYWLGDFIALVVTTFPGILTRQHDGSEVRFTALPADHPLTITMDTDRTTYARAGTTQVTRLATVDSHAALQDAIQAHAGAEVLIGGVHLHPLTSRMICLRLAGRRISHSRKHYKTHVRTAAERRGAKQVEGREAKWKSRSGAAAAGLSKLEWSQIRRVLGLGAWGQQMLYRLKAWANSDYDVRNGRVGCPHAACAHEIDVDLYHIFLACPAAQKLHTTFSGRCRSLGVQATDLEKAIFGLDLPEVPAGIWEIATQVRRQQSTDLTTLDECISDLTVGCWRLGAALYLHAVWRWWVQHFDDNNNVTVERHKLLLTYRLRQGYENMHLYVKRQGNVVTLGIAAMIIRQAFNQPWQSTHQTVTDDKGTLAYILFFDGGSRGNPGPGGSGAVVVRLPSTGGQYELVWAGNMSYAAQETTNNYAENMGLLVGLSACAKYGFTPLHVVGDSAIIIRQQRTRRAPKAPHLKPLYWRSRRKMTRLRVLTWQHHLRDQNRMADRLANLAMDSRQSKQLRLTPSLVALPPWQGLLELAEGDMEHWMLANMEPLGDTEEVEAP